MQKHFYWKIVLLILVSPIFLFAKIDVELAKKAVKDNADFLKDLSNISKKSTIKYSDKMSKIINDNNSSKDYKNNTIFYFYSTSMDISTIEHLLNQVKKFKKIKPDNQFFVVFNGFPKKDFWLKLRKLYKDKYKGILTFKIHPFIYKYFNIRNAPAYAYVNCPINDKFRFSKCKDDKGYLIRGDISLLDFFNILSSKTKKSEYKKLYFDLIRM